MKKIALARARWFVLNFLYYEHCFSEHGKQVTEETVLKHVGREFREKERKLVRKAIGQLISNGLVQAKRKHYGIHLWLNHARIEETKQMLLTPPPVE